MNLKEAKKEIRRLQREVEWLIKNLDKALDALAVTQAQSLPVHVPSCEPVIQPLGADWTYRPYGIDTWRYRGFGLDYTWPVTFSSPETMTPPNTFTVAEVDSYIAAEMPINETSELRIRPYAYWGGVS